MKLQFRQGLVSYTRDGFGNPQYLLPSATSGFISLNVSPTPVVATVAHGSSNYLLTFPEDVTNAWGPIASGVTSHLYWDVDLLTGDVTYGITTVEPVVSSTAPQSPAQDQHWFDLTSTTMKVWIGNKWYDKVRLFAGKVPNGSISSMTPADSEPLGASWRGALQVPGTAGHIALDILGRPLRMPNGEFVTSTSPVRFKTTTGTSGVLAVLPNAFVPVRAQQNIPAMSLVYFSGPDSVSLASGSPAVNPPRIPIGVVQEDLRINEVGAVTQSGEITFDQWDWSGFIGKPLYCGDNGEITTTRPAGLMAYRIGFVKGPQTILFQVDAETMPQIYQTGPSDVVVSGNAPLTSSFSLTPTGERLWTLSIPPATTGAAGHMTTSQVTALNTLGTRMTAAEAALAGKANVVHTHVIADVTGLQAALNDKAPVLHNHDLQYAPLNHNHDLQYAPLVHQHTIPDVAGLQTALNGKAERVHVNTLDEVFDGVNRAGSIDVGLGPNLRALLAAKIDKVPSAPSGRVPVFDGSGNIADSTLTTLDFAPANHTHGISAITGLQAALNGKAALVHVHSTSDVTGLTAALASKADVGHLHLIADVGGLQTALDGKAPLVHTHAIADVTGLQTQLTSLQSQINGKANTVHTHTIADVATLQDELDARLRKDNTAAYTPTGNYNPATKKYVDDLIGSVGSLFVFQVGAPMLSHAHAAIMTQQQAVDLIQNVNTTLPVTDPQQPYIVLTTLPAIDNHTHDITVYFDYVNHTFVVTDITNNSLYNHTAHLVGDGVYKPSLPSFTISLGTSSTFTLRTSMSQMQFASSYFSQDPNVSGWGGQFDQGQSFSGFSFPTTLDVSFDLQPSAANAIGTTSASWAGSTSSRVFEMVMNQAPTVGQQFFIGVFIQGAYPFGFSPTDMYGGSPFSTVWWTTTATSTTSGYGGGGNTGLPAWNVGDVLGIMFDNSGGGSLLRFYLNGVQVDSQTPGNNANLYIMCGCYTGT